MLNFDICVFTEFTEYKVDVQTTADAMQDRCGKEGAEPWLGEAFDFPVHLHSKPHLWS